jgi:ribonuclease J
MYKLIRPQALVPIHGERMHLHAHADFARSQGIPNVVVAENGDMVRIAPEPYEVVDQVHTGRVYLDGGSIIASSDRAFVERETLGQAGLIHVTLVLDDDGDTIAGPDVRLAGVPAHLDEGKADLEALIVKAVERQLAGMPSAQRIIEEAVEGEVKHAVRRVLGPRWDKRPMIMANAICLEE